MTLPDVRTPRLEGPAATIDGIVAELERHYRYDPPRRLSLASLRRMRRRQLLHAVVAVGGLIVLRIAIPAIALYVLTPTSVQYVLPGPPVHARMRIDGRSARIPGTGDIMLATVQMEKPRRYRELWLRSREWALVDNPERYPDWARDPTEIRRSKDEIRPQQPPTGRGKMPYAMLNPGPPPPPDPGDPQVAQARESKMLAAYTSAKQAGRPARIIGDGVRVMQAYDSGLEPGIVMTEVAGVRVRSSEELLQIITRLPRDRPVEMRLVDGTLRTWMLPPVGSTLAEVTAGVGFGIRTTSPKAITSPQVSFELPKQVVGSSGGLAMALIGYSALAHVDLSQGRTVVATGAVGGKGEVFKVDGVALKALGAREAGADVFIVPKELEGQARHFVGTDLKIVGVSTVQEAIDYLRRPVDR